MQVTGNSTGHRKVLTMQERAESFALVPKYQRARVRKSAMTLKCCLKDCPSLLTWSLILTNVCFTGQIVAILHVVTLSIAPRLMENRRIRVRRFYSPT